MSTESKLRVLLIDADSAHLAKLFDALAQNYEVCVLNSGQEALDQFECMRPDLLVLEMSLPDLDGVQLVRQIHRREKDRQTPCVFLSHKDSAADMRLGYMVHAVRCFSKKMPLSRFATEMAILVHELGLKPRPKHQTLADVHSHQEHKARQDLLAKQKPTAAAPDSETTPAPGPSPGPMTVLPSAPPVHRVRVLLADQEPPRMTSVEAALNRYADCILCCSGLEALDKAIHYLPDVFVLGVRLYHLPGFQVTQTLRGHPEFQKSPVLGTIEPDDPINRESLKRYGFSAVFEIPRQTDTLAFEVARLAYDSGFVRHAYPMTFEEVVSHEEFLRLKGEKTKGQIEAQRRMQPFREFLRNTPKDY
jgi:PleD family two-component response regulator